MKGKTIFVFLLMVLFISPMVLAEEGQQITKDNEDMQDIGRTIRRVIDLVSLIGGGIAVLAASVVGIMMMQTNDPAEKDMLKERLKYIIIGLIIIAVAPQIVKLVLPTDLTLGAVVN